MQLATDLYRYSHNIKLMLKPSLKRCFAASVALVLVAACSEPKSSEHRSATNTQSADSARMDKQTAFRIRADFDAALNASKGWAAGVNEPATVHADRPFRLRFEVEASPRVEAERHYRVEVRRNKGKWQPLGAENFPQPAKVLALAFETEPTEPLDDLWEFVHGSNSAMRWNRDEASLQVKARDQAVLAMARYDTHWEALEFAVELRLSKQGGNRAGVVFGYRNAENYFRVDVDAANKIEVVQLENGRESVLAEHPAEVTPGQWFELKLIMQEQTLTVEYDDEALLRSSCPGHSGRKRRPLFAGGQRRRCTRDCG